ncbi:MAG: hypothetical protein ACHQ4H_06460 [Ktedonobacterales bacterium]
MEVDHRDDAGDPRQDERDDQHDATIEDATAEDGAEEAPLIRVRYGLGKELRLYPDAIVVAYLEAHEETRYTLANIRRLILMPGDYTPSKLVLMFELDDGNTVIATEGMTNVRAFRPFLAQFKQIAPQIELDPENMDEQLSQALDIKRRYSLGCYGAVIGSCVVLWILYLVVAFVGQQHH